jgi:hypothetical protein
MTPSGGQQLCLYFKKQKPTAGARDREKMERTSRRRKREGT